MQTINIKNNVYLTGGYSIVGPLEGKGPLKDYFDYILNDDTLKEKTFEKIKEYITVSVKMDEKEAEEREQAFEDEEEEKKSEIMEEQEKKARAYLEDTLRLVEDMSEAFSKQKVEEKVNYIFNKEKNKKELEEKEALKEKEKEKELDKDLTKEQRQKELGTN